MMKTPRITLTPAELRWNEQGEPVSATFDDVYYSQQDGLEETRHVFLQHNHLQQRWQDWPASRGHFTIAETGFGSGLNFLAAWQLWREVNPPGRLHFISVEKYPLTRQDLASSLQRWPALAELSAALVRDYPPLIDGLHRISLDGGRVQLSLLFGDVMQTLPWLKHGDTCPSPVDAWFLDGFAPARNADMWQPELYPLMASLSRPGATVATFTAAGDVRRGLQGAGFAVARVKGYGNKREMLAGHFATGADETHGVPEARTPVLVIGAGLAGASTARALASRGYPVTVLDAATPGAGASGNRQGLLYAKLSAHASPQADLALFSFLFAERHYAAMLPTCTDMAGSLQGLLQLPADTASASRQQQVAEAFASVPELVRSITATEASSLAGIDIRQDGLLFPAAGWLSPPVLCRAWLDHPGITLQSGVQVDTLVRENGHWVALDAGGQRMAEAHIVVLANGVDSLRLHPLPWLTLRESRGQVTHLQATAGPQSLRLPVSHDGYLTPAWEGLHCAGATFHRADPCPDLRDEDHQHNLDTLRQHLPAFASALGEPPVITGGRVGWRVSSPDFQPVAGAIPGVEGLFLNTAHGARGLATTPFCAEWLACLISGEPLPGPVYLDTQLAPGRFLKRRG